MKKVAIVGSSKGWSEAPFDDPSWEIWSLNNMYKKIKTLPNGRWTRWFDIHEKAIDRPKHKEVLASLGCPVYVNEKWSHLLNSVVYPFEEVKKEFFINVNREQFFTSSIAYMTALAIYEGFDEISFYGINQSLQTEYEKQLPCIDFWVGIALGKGIRVNIQKHSNILNPEKLYK